MTRITMQPYRLSRTVKVVRWVRTAAVLTPALMLSSFAVAGDETTSPFEKSGGSIIKVAGQAELSPTAPPAPLRTASAQEAAAIDSAKPNPRNLRPITAITPSYDYDPDGKDPCEHICPLVPGRCPEDKNLECPVEEDLAVLTTADRAFPDMNYMWCASNLYHNPLYFEDVQLERYGHVKCNEVTQSFVSMGKFGAQLVGLPYQMALDNPHDCRYALGYYRPGDCAPRKHYRVPLNAKAAAVSAPVYAGAVLLLQ
jgi:hypothetical protein